jgi:hypothetical protein
MKFFIINFLVLMCFKASAQDTVACKDLSAYTGRKVTIQMRAAGFDMRREYIYLYYGNGYPEQDFTVMIKRNDGKKRIKLNKDIILGLATAPLTGYIATYDGEPDSTKNYDDAAVKKEYEKVRPVVIIAFNQPAIMRPIYPPRKGPINLKGKLVMLITQQWQIGATHQLPQLRLVGPPQGFGDTDF